MKKTDNDNGAWGCLVVVDVQKAFPPPPALLDRIRHYARRFERRVFTRFENPPGSLFRRVLDQHSCAPGSPDTDLLIEPAPGDLVFVKRGYGLPPKDIRRLKQLGLKRVTVCGVDTDACVLGVMFSLFDAGIECRVKKELCWSSSGLHATGMRIIEEQFPPPQQGGVAAPARRARKAPAARQGRGRAASKKPRTRARPGASASASARGQTGRRAAARGP